MSIARQLPDREWALQSVDTFPRSWQARLLDRWRRDHRADRTAGNLGLLRRVRTLADSARGGIRPDAGDMEICQQAKLTAQDFIERLQRVGWDARERGEHLVERMQVFFARHVMRERGLIDLWPAKKNRPRSAQLKRIQCEHFWRRTYRKLHARTVEACAISIGLVRQTAGLYASDDTVQRRAAQNARNAAVLADVIAVNDHGQDYTLADLAAKGTANKSIRRVELLTRIAGFELIAKDCTHVGVMVTTTCPSRFHKATTRRDGRVVDNPRFDGSTPNEGQRHLSGCWSRARSAAARAGIDWYGFRIAEPQHDGTPHWHSLLFMPVAHAEAMQRIVRKYFLDQHDPHEPGAQEHRVRFDWIDWNKGSAVGYVIKYVSKNIDGHGVGQDLFGNDAITSSQRVEAWASTWRIRQFQQIGGAPVGTWRELRRVHPDNLAEGAPDPLRECLVAVNLAKTEPGVQSIAWKRYTAAQGGIGTKRKHLRIRLHREEQTGECGRYGEAMPARVVGVEADGVQRFRNHIHDMNPHAPLFERRLFATVESERAQWLIGQGDRAQSLAAAVRVFGIQRSGEAASTRIHVNNCTGAASLTPTLDRLDRAAPRSMFAPVIQHRRKLRQFRSWPAASTQESSLCDSTSGKPSRSSTSSTADSARPARSTAPTPKPPTRLP